MWTLPLNAPARSGLPSRVVLRLAPDADLAAWETTLQASVAEQGYPTPVVRASDFTPSAGMRAWCVMDHADGAPILGGLSGLRALAALPRLATGLPDTAASPTASSPPTARSAHTRSIRPPSIGTATCRAAGS